MAKEIYNFKREMIWFFTEADEFERVKFADFCLQAYYDAIAESLEALGIIFKYLPNYKRKQILEAIHIEDVLRSSDNCVSFFNFFRFVIRDVKPTDKKKLVETLRKIGDIDKYNTTVKYLVKMYMESPILHKTSKVLLLIPEFLSSISFLQPPIDFMTVARILEENGLACDIFDNRVFNYSIESIIQKVNRYDYIVLTSTPIDMAQKYFVDYRYAVFCYTFTKIRQAYPSKKMYVVGPHGTVAKNMLISDIPIVSEMIIEGEYESRLSERILADFGICLKNVDPLSLIPDYSKIKLSWYFGRTYKKNICLYKPHMAIMQISRGCPYGCAFCYDFYGHKVRYRSFGTIVKELQLLKKKHASNLFFIDQTFTLNRELIIKMCYYMIDNGFDLTWQCETRADLLDEVLVSLMKSAGCTSIWLGIESFSQDVLDKNNKGIRVEDIYHALDICRSCGIDLCGFIMIGMPGETKNTLKNTINEIKRLGLHISPSINLCTTRIGSKLFKSMQKEGLVVRNFFELNQYDGAFENDIEQSDISKAEAELINFWREYNGDNGK